MLTSELRRDADGPFRLFQVTQQEGWARIVPGLDTKVFGYNGMVPGPIIRATKGMRVKLRVRNQLPVDGNPISKQAFNTSTHLHGSASLPQYDGYADDVAHPGDYKDYWYPNWQPARTLWYHDHNVHTTAQNAYAGLAAQYHLYDDAERELLPVGDYDVPITINDVLFNADGSLAYDDRSHSGLMGDVILVNGRPWPVMQVKRKVYRFRVLNAAISRSLRLYLSNGAPMHMVATDGGLMPQTRAVTEYRHGGAERYEFLIDFSKFPVGTNIDLRNRSNKNNVDFDHTNKIMRFQVVDDGDLPADGPNDISRPIPNLLVNSEPMDLKAEDVTGRLYMRLGRDDVTNIFQINNLSWHDVVDSGYKQLLTRAEPDQVHEWDIENKTGGGWFHPLHIHLTDFQIISRNGQPAFDYEKGPKDVVYVGEDERVRVRLKFTLQEGGGNSLNRGGRYMVHCHNLPHEDHDMMHQFAVGNPDVNDPITSAPCKPDDYNYDDGDPFETPISKYPPRVAATTPAYGCQVDTNVTVTFTKEVNGITAENFTLVNADGDEVPATVAVSAHRKVAVLNPRWDLPQLQRFTARLGDGITDDHGHEFEPFEWSFKTGVALNATPPVVTAMKPADGATGIAIGSNMTATFNRAVRGVDETTMTLTTDTGLPVAATVSMNSTNRVAILNPVERLQRLSKYVVTLTGGPDAIRDMSGVPLKTVSWSFTTW